MYNSQCTKGLRSLVQATRIRTDSKHCTKPNRTLCDLLIENCELIKLSPLFIKEPTPFIEIQTHVLDMNPEHVFVIIRRTRVCVRNSPLRIIERQPVAMDAAGKVYILRVHKKTFVKQPRFHSRFCA